MKHNKKGMTLIEIVVVLVISSLILVVAGTVILNGFGYFDKTERADKDKYAVDKIAELVRDELAYASDVRVETVTNPPNENDHKKLWHWISLENGRIYKDGNLLYSDDFYQNRTLKLNVRLYQNDYRMDMEFSFLDLDGKQMYKTTSTLELINLKSSLIDKSTRYEKTSISDNDEGKYRIYYKSDFSFIPGEKPDEPSGQPDPDKPSGTVEDEKLCNLNGSDFDDKKDYLKGDFVFYEGIWYRAVNDVGNHSKPDNNNQGNWKAITYYWVKSSSYLTGDVINYPKDSTDFYQCVRKNDGGKVPSTDSEFWQILTKEEHEQIIEEHKNNNFCKVIEDSVDDLTVGGETRRCLDKYALVIWKEGASVKQGNYVSYNGEVYRYINAGTINYIVNGHMPGDTGTSAIWKLIKTTWTPNVYYAKNDIVEHLGKYYQAIETVTSNFSPDALPGQWKSYNSLEEIKNLIDSDNISSPSCDIYR